MKKVSRFLLTISTVVLLSVLFGVQPKIALAQVVIHDKPVCEPVCYYDSGSGENRCLCNDDNAIVTPEPLSLVLFGGGLLGVALRRRFKA